MEKNEKLYLGVNGRYYKEHELATAYFLTTGDCVWTSEIDDYHTKKFDIWVHDLIGLSIKKIVNMNDVSYEELLRGGQKILAVQVYRDRWNCTLREAKEAIDEIQAKLEAK